MPTTFYNWKIGGEAGYGIMNTAGPIFAKTLLRGGFFVFIYSEYPSLIRGGHNTMQAAVSSKPINAVYSQLDQLVALNWHTVVMHQDEVKKGGVVIYDADNSRMPPLTGTHTVKKAKNKVKLRQDIKFIPVNFTKIAEETGGDKIMKNVAAVGAALRQFKVQSPLQFGGQAKSKVDLLEIGREVIEDVFESKGQGIVKANQRVLEAGYNSIRN
ncbi:MAG: 2-oxoacid:acceptor oxidoreductase family protein [Patescibacteria group bacterium]